MTRNLLRWIARVMIGALLFSQLAVAAHACSKMLPSGNTMGMAAAEQPMPMTAASADAKADVEVTDCADMATKTDDASGNICAAHCLYGQQSDKASTITVPVALLTALYITPPVPEMALPPRSAAGTLNALVASSPPHTVLHCVYRI
jgi:hypothetical protein